MPNKIRTKLRDITNDNLPEVRRERIDELDGSTTIKIRVPVAQSASTYKPSYRNKKIATQKRSVSAKENEKDLGAVKPSALAYQTTERDRRLATPRVWHFSEGVHIRSDPFSTSKAAMDYVATPRILELAKPVIRRVYNL